MNKKIVILGNGTGSSRLVAGFKSLTSKQFTDELSIIINVSDNGGHSGELRIKDKRLIALGDWRANICEASTNSYGKLWNKRDNKGRSIGNLELYWEFLKCGNYFKLIDWANNKLETFARVIPVSIMPYDICARFNNGEIAKGEWQVIDKAVGKKIEEMFIDQKVDTYQEVIDKIILADLIIIAPGAIHTGIISFLLLNGIKQAFRKSIAHIAYFSNIMSFPGGTENMSGNQQVVEIEKYLGRMIDVIFVHQGTIPTNLIRHYEKYNSYPVDWDKDDRLKFDNYLPVDTDQLITQERVGHFKKWTHIIQHNPNTMINNFYKWYDNYYEKGD